MSDTIAEITKELQLAIEKHPEFAPGGFVNLKSRGVEPKELALFVAAYIVDNFRASCEKHKDVVSVLEEECFEAIEAALQGDYSHARQEFAQVAAVAIRAMMMCRAAQEAKE